VTFLTFLLYFLASMVIYDLSTFLVLTTIKFFVHKRLQNSMQQNMEANTITLEELVEKINESKQGDDGTWH